MDRQQEFVLRTIEERDIRFVRLWFTDVLGILKSVAVAPAELEGAFAEGIGFDGSAIEGFARVYEADMLAKPDPATFQVLPWRGESPGTARMFCDILTARRHAEHGRPAPRAASARSTKAADQGFTFYTHPEIEFFLFKQRLEPGASARAGRPGAATSTTCRTAPAHDFRRAAITMLESMGISVEFSHHEGAPGPERDRPALRRRADHGRQHHDLPHGGQGGRARAGHLRHVHAQAVRRAPRLRHAHPPVAVRGRPQRVLRGRRAVPAVQDRRGSSSPACCSTRAEITAVTNQWVNSYKRLWGGGEAPALRLLGPQQPLGPGPGADVQARQGPVGRVEVPRARPRRATPTSPSRCCSPPASRASRRATSCPPGAEDDVWALTDAERRALGIEPLPRQPRRGDRGHGDSPSWSPRPSASTSSTSSCATSAREWDDYRRQVTPFELRALPAAAC